MAIGDPFTTAVPFIGSSGPGFAEDINSILDECILRLSNKVPLSSLDISSDLDLNGSRLLNVGYMTISGETVSPVSSPVNRLTTFAGDLWYVSPSSAIKMTTGGTLNAGAIGGITGDYGGANPAQFRFDDINQRYDAYDDFGTGTWAFVRAQGFDIAGGATSLVSARLLFAGVANRTYTLPAAPPSVTAVLLMDSSGNITTQAAQVLNFSTASATPKGDAIQDVVTLSYPAITWGSGLAGNKMAGPLDRAVVGSTITAWSVTINKSAGTGQLDAQLRDLTVSTGTTAQIGVTQSSSSTGVVTFSQSGLSATIVAGHVYFILVSAPGSANIGGEARIYAFTVQ